MNRIHFIGVIAALLLIVAACAPAATVGDSSAVQDLRLTPPAGLTKWNAEIHGVQVHYEVVDPETSPVGQTITENNARIMSSTLDGCSFSILPIYFDAVESGQE